MCSQDSGGRCGSSSSSTGGALQHLQGPIQIDGIPERGRGTASIPRPGEARRSRMADVPVLALSLRAGETLLVVDRVYADHLCAWIRETLLDFADA